MRTRQTTTSEFLRMHQVELEEWAPPVCVVLMVLFVLTFSMIHYRITSMNRGYTQARNELTEALQEIGPVVQNIDGEEIVPHVTNEPENEIILPPADMTPKMTEVHTMNNDTAGWIKVDGMVIDYPVMQTLDDEEYYLNRDFEGNYSAYGCILADTDSTIGTGTRANDYCDGTRPSTNIILHGHNMKNGTMFGSLDDYRSQDFERQHNIIKFSSLYEDREYEIVSVFLSQVYRKSDDVFKYYKFFEATNEEEFYDFYDNIKALALYDTGVDATYGDEFITLSVCAYHVEDGRLVVVGKRIK